MNEAGVEAIGAPGARGADETPGVHRALDGRAGTSLLPAPLAVHRAGKTALLAEYPDPAAVLAAAAAVRALAPAHLADLVPAERTLLLRGASGRDPQRFAALLAHLPAAEDAHGEVGEVSVGIVYDGEDLGEVADLLGMSTDALISAHSGTVWEAAFGGFAPGFAYLLPVAEPGAAPHDRDAGGSNGDVGRAGAGAPPVPALPPWEVPRRAEPRTAVPAGAVGLAAGYCGIYPRPSPGGWQLIGRSDAALFDVRRDPPALLTPGTRVHFAPQRALTRATPPRAGAPFPSSAFAQSAPALALQRAREAAAVQARAVQARALQAGAMPERAVSSLRARRGESTGTAARPATASGAAPTSEPTTGPASEARPALEVLAPGPLTLLEDGGRPGRAAIGVSPSGAFDRGALSRANLAVGNPSGAAVLETVAGPLALRVTAPTVVAISGALAPLTVERADEEVGPVDLASEDARERAIALDPGDRLEVGPAAAGLRLVLAVRGGVAGIRRDGETAADPDTLVLGARCRDTLSGLGPAPLQVGDVLLVGSEHGLDAVPPPAEITGEHAVDAHDSDTADTADPGAPSAPLLVPVRLGPRDALLGAAAVAAFLAAEWTVRPDSDRVGVRLDGPPLPVPDGAAGVPSEPMLPGAVQIPPSGLPVVFGPDHPTTGGYPVIAVVTRAGLDALAQAAAGTALRFTDAADCDAASSDAVRG
ncbi:5-oxoprolinase subunit B/C family protein [Brachybacterium aquaticum]|uniref:Biotin-dependent carboxylase-like uncharacterized protein n=1 Tax=Brachybacterium aquaticum TaxID=1432564 RepID=A0A841AI02_9MICO|nr:carboxyltransferase domain-containing protein [Brachybacterium aquaticum]MBB5833211.1 biotin-dependent carboxylase-like uncharacterized protein [Brachybacterium aquaticum]